MSATDASAGRQMDEMQGRVLAAISPEARSGFEVALALGLAGPEGDGPAGSQALLYPALHRLEAEGLLEADWQRSETGLLRRRYRRPLR